MLPYKAALTRDVVPVVFEAVLMSQESLHVSCRVAAGLHGIVHARTVGTGGVVVCSCRSCSVSLQRREGEDGDDGDLSRAERVLHHCAPSP